MSTVRSSDIEDMKKNSGLSLRVKFLLALILIPALGVTIFLALAIKIFENDKVAYVFESSLTVSKTKAARVESELSSMIKLTQSMVLGYSTVTRTLAEASSYFFDKEEKLAALQLFVLNPANGEYEKVVSLIKESSRSDMQKESAFESDLVRSLRETEVKIKKPVQAKNSLLMGLRFGQVSDPRHVIAVALFKTAELAQAFQDTGSYATVLIQGSGEPLFETPALGEADWAPVQIWSELSRKNSREGTAEIRSPRNQPYLASFAGVDIGDLQVVSVVSRKTALKAVNLIIEKSLFFSVLVLSLISILGVVSARGLTEALSRLTIATKKVTQGDFKVRVASQSDDEIGVLATSFNHMAEEVSRLMLETAEKARMESELETARAVQETLFPENRALLGGVEIAGHYQPASECGGDWWFYCENGDSVYLWIGDATGHGAPAALLTSAARAVASVIQGGPPLSPGQAMGILNRAICETSKGKMMMTFALIAIDKKTGLLTYSNASHEPPMILRGQCQEISRNDFLALTEVNNPRLGENYSSHFKEGKIQLEPGDRLVLYTDGVMDVKSPEQKTWGERRFVKALSASMMESRDPGQSVTTVVQSLTDFRKKTPLDDDVTLVLCSYRGAA